MDRNIEALYEEARSALKAKYYDRAGDLFRQILLIDENYRDTSRLLAQAVRLRRRRWYNNPRLWGAVAIVGLVLIGIWLAPRLQRFPSTPNTQPIVSPTTAITVTKTENPTETATPALPSIPLTWKRIYIGQEFARDSITAIVIDPRDRDVIYAGTANAGVYKSIDGGISWQPIHNGLGRAAISRLVLDPSNSNTLYASTQGSLYRTMDGGTSWQELAQDREFQDGNTFIVVDPQDSQRLYYSTRELVYRSTDSGANWQIVKSGESCPTRIHSAFAGHITESGILYASQWETRNTPYCQAGLYRSSDGGASWEMIGMEGNQWIDQIAVGIDLRGNEVLYITQAAEDPPELYVSHDDGKSWQSIGERPGILLVDPDQPGTVYAGRYKSEDGGYTWEETTTDPPLGYTAMAVLNQGKTILAGTRSGLFISSDGGKSWNEHNNGLASIMVDLKVDPTDSYTFYAELLVDPWLSGDVYRSTDGGQNWTLLKRGRGLAMDGEGGIYQVQGTDLLYSQDKGGTWKTSSLPLTGERVTGLGTNPALPGTVFVASSGQELIFSTDRGASWQTSGVEAHFSEVNFFFDSDGGKKGYMIPFFNALRTSDGGVTWQPCAWVPWSPLTPSIMTMDPRDSDRILLAVLGDGLYRSEDGCQSWQKSNTGLTSLFVNSVAISPNNPDTVYAGTDGGAFVSFDGGQTWYEINDGLLGATVVYSIVVDKDNKVYAATPYGIFKLEGK